MRQTVIDKIQVRVLIYCNLTQSNFFLANWVPALCRDDVTCTHDVTEATVTSAWSDFLLNKNRSLFILFTWSDSPQILHDMRSTFQYSLVPGLAVFLSFVRRSHLFLDQIPGAYRWHGSCIHISASAWQPGEMLNVTAFALLHLPTILQSGRSMVVGDVLTVHTCSFMCTNYIYVLAHTPAFLQIWEHFHHPNFHHASSKWQPTSGA